MMITPPQTPTGTPEVQLVQIYRYLYSLSEQLNATAATLDSQATKASEAIAKAAGVPASPPDKNEGQYSALISLIVKTANIVQTQMDKIVTTLGYSYIAKSEWGVYEEKIQRQVEDTAKNTMETFIYDAKQESLTKDEAEGFVAHLEGFIVRGIIDFKKEEDGTSTPIIGIAIGKELFKKTEVVDGKTYEVIDTSVDVATYTANEMAFWLNGTKVAYFNQDTLNVTKAVVHNSIQLGDWFIDVNANEGMSVQQRVGESIVSTNPTIKTMAETIKTQATLIETQAQEITTQADLIKMVLADENEKVQKWFTFNNKEGLTIRRPAYTDKDGNKYEACVYSTQTDEKGYHVRRDDLAEDILTADIDGVKASALRIGKMICRETEDGGWIWMEA